MHFNHVFKYMDIKFIVCIFKRTTCYIKLRVATHIPHEIERIQCNTRTCSSFTLFKTFLKCSKFKHGLSFSKGIVFLPRNSNVKFLLFMAVESKNNTHYSETSIVGVTPKMQNCKMFEIYQGIKILSTSFFFIIFTKIFVN